MKAIFSIAGADQGCLPSGLKTFGSDSRFLLSIGRDSDILRRLVAQADRLTHTIKHLFLVKSPLLSSLEGSSCEGSCHGRSKAKTIEFPHWKSPKPSSRCPDSTFVLPEVQHSRSYALRLPYLWLLHGSSGKS